MTRSATLAIAACLLLTACAGEGDEDAVAPLSSPSFPVATALLDNGDESTLVTVEVAETPEQHSLGLSDRDSIPDDWGMVFVFFEARDVGLELTGVGLPLSVAYFDATGEILEIADVGPCEEGPCPAPDLDVRYMGALAVNRGSFAEWDIAEGDVARLTR